MESWCRTTAAQSGPCNQGELQWIRFLEGARCCQKDGSPTGTHYGSGMAQVHNCNLVSCSWLMACACCRLLNKPDERTSFCRTTSTMCGVRVVCVCWVFWGGWGWVARATKIVALRGPFCGVLQQPQKKASISCCTPTIFFGGGGACMFLWRGTHITGVWPSLSWLFTWASGDKTEIEHIFICCTNCYFWWILGMIFLGVTETKLSDTCWVLVF